MNAPATGGSNMLVGGALISVVVGLWGRIKVWAAKIMSLFVVKIECEGHAGRAMAILINKEFKSSPLGEKKYSGHQEYVRPERRSQIVAFESIPTEPTIWWRHHRPLVVTGDGGTDIVLSFLRGTYSRDTLVMEAVDAFNAEKNRKDWKSGDRFHVRKCHGSIGNSRGGLEKTRGKGAEVDAPTAVNTSQTKLTARPLRWLREEIGQPKNGGAIGRLSLGPDAISAMQEAVLWRDSEDWFKARSIPWKRGWLLYGGPGTGKTIFTRALGQELNMPIFSFDLATMTNKDFSDEWSKMMGWSPCIALFEDNDSVFCGRENVAANGMENGLTFDGFLNCLDGVENTDGIFVVVTTNDISKLDPAIGNPTNGESMSTRPGRIDRAIEFLALDRDGRVKMANRIMEGLPEDQWKHLVDEYGSDTGAQFQERCCRLALQLFWANTNEAKTEV